MALKPDRNLLDTRIDYFMNEVASRGGVAVIGTSSSGVAMDSAVSVATYAAASSGRIPLGILVCDVFDKDLTKTHLNYYKEEVQKGQKVTLLTKGYVVTDMLVPATTPSGGNPAYMGPSGLLTPTLVANVTPLVGRFETAKDEDGYVKVSINL